MSWILGRMPQAAEDEPGPLASSVATLRLIAGWACVALAVLNLAMGISPATYAAFHLMLLVTGLLLLGTGRIAKPPSRFAVAAGGAVAALGLIGTAIPVLAVECCSRGYAVRHGFPFTMLARDPGDWRFDLGRTVADLVFWLCAGLIVMLVVAQARPAAPRTGPSTWSGPATPPRGTVGHAESRSAGRHARPDPDTKGRTADGENVGGLP
ncbi:hypothetical protein JIG36_44380 [Actinoplanes sp. LDG1-06]|uniref:Uncharacterized protein n=1 Tax=Paractinoplanes ovalisporus TaxID=2810368 RepID=A0ABS2AS54_9ACTN|nr:hypothetical protein [Actinoplanes ovalisporus]MBM2622563.1 hypothetical protein [Actinoplanes ovalisporus]